MVELDIPGHDQPETYYYEEGEGDEATDPDTSPSDGGDPKEDEDSATVEG